MENEAADGDDDLSAELEEAIAESGHLHPHRGRPGRSKSQLLHRDIGGCRQENAELVGPEARATGAVDGKIEEELLDAILGISPRAVTVFMDVARALPEVCDEEARVVLGSPGRGSA